MTKFNLTKKSNWRIVIEVIEVEEPIIVLGDIEKATRRHCEDLIQDIKRHIDIDGVIAYESDTVCAFCGSLWKTEQSKNDPDVPFDMPLCCEKAAEMWKKSKEG